MNWRRSKNSIRDDIDRYAAPLALKIAHILIIFKRLEMNSILIQLIPRQVIELGQLKSDVAFATEIETADSCLALRRRLFNILLPIETYTV
jgi:hypothetical protein